MATDQTNTTATSDIPPTEADLARDLRADLEAYQERAALVDEIAMHSGCTDYACYCHFILPAALRRAIAAEAELKQLKTSTYCAYCGHTEPIDGDGERIAEHIRTCEKHPMRAVEARVKELEQTLLQGVLQLKGMRDEVDRLLQEAEEFQKQMEAKGE